MKQFRPEFTELEAWQEAHQLVMMIYDVTKTFPPGEDFVLSGGLRNSSVLSTSHIAKGYSFPGYRDRAESYLIAQGAIREIQDHIEVARGVDYINLEVSNQLQEKCEKVFNLIDELIRVAFEKLHESS